MIEYLYTGAGAALLGAMVGAWIGARLNYGFQKKLLQQQLEFQQRLLDQQLDAEKKSHEETLRFLDKAALGEAIGGKSLREQIHNEGQGIKQAIEALNNATPAPRP